MSEDTSPVPFELSHLKELIKLMEDHDLSEVDLHRGDQRCRLRRGPQGFMVPPPQSAITPPPPAAPEVKQVATQVDTRISIKSPTVGTFYVSANPEDPPFVRVGARVSPDTVVCLVEAMKVFNQITADCSGTIVEVCVENAHPVEYGQILFRVQP